MDFDETRLYYSHQQLQRQRGGENSGGDSNNQNGDDDFIEGTVDDVELSAVRRHFREFLRKFTLIVGENENYDVLLFKGGQL